MIITRTICRNAYTSASARKRRAFRVCGCCAAKKGVRLQFPGGEIRDHPVVQAMRVREVKDEAERTRLWDAASGRI